MRKTAAIILLMLLFFSCTQKNEYAPSGTTDAYVPIYASATDVTKIFIEQPKPIQQAGKIYAYGNYIFQNDINTGIHIVSASLTSLYLSNQ